MRTSLLAAYGVGAIATFAMVFSILPGIAQAKPKTAILYVLDGSGSSSHATDQEIAAMVVDMEAAPADADVTVAVMASQTVEIFSGSIANTEPAEIAQIAKRALVAPDLVKGTDFSAMAVAADRWISRTDAPALKIRVMSDGGDDFGKDPKRSRVYSKAASRIIKSGRVASLVFHGVKSGYRESIRAHFGALGGRLRILSSGESSLE